MTSFRRSESPSLLSQTSLLRLAPPERYQQRPCRHDSSPPNQTSRRTDAPSSPAAEPIATWDGPTRLFRDALISRPRLVGATPRWRRAAHRPLAGWPGSGRCTPASQWDTWPPILPIRFNEAREGASTTAQAVADHFLDHLSRMLEHVVRTLGRQAHHVVPSHDPPLLHRHPLQAMPEARPIIGRAHRR